MYIVLVCLAIIYHYSYNREIVWLLVTKIEFGTIMQGGYEFEVIFKRDRALQ